MPDDLVSRIVAQELLPDRLAKRSTEGAVQIIDRLLSSGEAVSQTLISDPAFLRQIRDQLTAGAEIAKIGVLVPVGLWGFNHGLTTADLDISLLGIGNHRFFLFHSAIGLAILRYIHRQWLANRQRPETWLSRVGEKISGAALSGYAIGVGVHLMIDVFQPKSVVFPFFGSLVDGTLVDDRTWLLANSLWAFKIGHDVFALTFASDLETAKAFVAKRFGREIDLAPMTKGGR